MTVSRAAVMTPSQPNVIALANTLNWGMYSTLDSIAQLEEIHREGRKQHQVVVDLCQDIDVDALSPEEQAVYAGEQLDYTNATIASLFMIGVPAPKKPKSKDQRVEENKAKGDKAAAPKPKAETAPKPALVAKAAPAESSLSLGNGIRFTQGGKDVEPEAARDMLSNSATPSQLYEKRDIIVALLDQQKQLSASTRIGKSVDEQRVVTEMGIEGQVMALTVRQAYAEAMETAVAQMDLERLCSIEDAINATYGAFMSKH